MEIGNMKHKIIIQRPTVTQNENGYDVTTFVDYKTSWAAVNNLFGDEYFIAMQSQAQNTIKFLIRYIADIDTTMRIIFKQKIYNITFIDNIRYGNSYMEIRAIEVI